MDIEQIAHVLSQNNMLGGHTPYPYSAAQAAVFRSMLTSRKCAYEVLHSLDGLAGTRPCTDAFTAEQFASNARADAFERQILLGDAESKIAHLPLGQYAHLREVVYALRQLHPRRARDMYLERHYALVREVTP